MGHLRATEFVLFSCYRKLSLLIDKQIMYDYCISIRLSCEIAVYAFGACRMVVLSCFYHLSFCLVLIVIALIKTPTSEVSFLHTFRLLEPAWSLSLKTSVIEHGRFSYN